MGVPRSRCMVVSGALLNLITRDYVEDVRRLNTRFSLSGNTELAEHIPPHTFVGNLSGVTPGDCVLLMGINPFLGSGAEFQRLNIDLPNNCIEMWNRTGKIGAFKKWMDFQENYFLSDAYNGKHFTKIGNLLGRRWFSETYDSYDEKMRSRMVMHHHLIEFDVIPYYSKNASFNSKELAEAMETDPALMVHMDFISSIIKQTKPRWIQVNGNGPTKVMMECFVDGDVEILNDGNSLRTEIRVGYSKIGDTRIPVLMHKFLKSPNGPQSFADWDIIWETWNNWLT